MYKLKQILTSAAFTLFTGFALMSGNAIASTPDSETPANEGVCDTLQGATPGLYGLCVAYCEAQDLDTFDKKPPSLKILANYNKKKQATDPEMPCLKTPCPCWTDDELTSISVNASSCGQISPTAVQIMSAAGFHLADADTGIGQERCRYIDTVVKPDGVPVVRSFDITPDEAQGCYTQIQNSCSQ